MNSGINTRFKLDSGNDSENNDKLPITIYRNSTPNFNLNRFQLIHFIIVSREEMQRKCI